ncbi:MAG TPA: S24/S26 family peptidase, partial [Thermoanaerobaculia bacterium]|nr:S24/S26 family peptidase [Thermoanaerobaculia bacterium]
MTTIDAADVIADLLRRGHAAEFRVHGDSMHPVIRAEDVLHVEPSAEIRAGDVVLTLADRGLTAHRVIHVSAEEVITRGDNTPSADAPVARSRVLGVVTYVLRDGVRMPVRAESWVMRMLRRVWRRTPLFALFLATGLVALAYTWVTVHRRPGEQLSQSSATLRTHAAITYWLEHGYFSTYGLMVPSREEPVVYRWSSGAVLITGFAVEKIWVAITGRFSWRLLAVHNTFMALLIATCLALLAYRLARRLGAGHLHAFALGVCVQMVQFTFPESLWLYWELQREALFLLPACLFLLFDERVVPRAIAAFAATWVELFLGTMFLASYAIAVLLLRDERPRPRRLVATVLLPWLAAMALYATQYTLAKQTKPMAASSFAYRTGMDGDSTFYRDHLDIAFGRELVRGENSRGAWLYRWPVLFFAGALAALVALVLAREARVPLASLLGAYVLHAAVFSQAVALHPYIYDIILAAPLILALFALVPALAEAR